MVETRRERRSNPRLRIGYPIQVHVREPDSAGGTRGVTSNLSARGAYFKTFAWKPFRQGQRVTVAVQVPHPLHSGEEIIQLSMSGKGRIRRLDRIVGREALGEDGLDLKGVALEFDAPLEFNYFWT